MGMVHSRLTWLSHIGNAGVACATSSATFDLWDQPPGGFPTSLGAGRCWWLGEIPQISVGLGEFGITQKIFTMSGYMWIQLVVAFEKMLDT